MANQVHVRILQQGANVWNRWRKQHPMIKPNLKGVDLGISGMGQSEEELRRWGLSEDHILAIKLSAEGLQGINLSNSDLRKANLWKVNLCYADLRDANLQGAYLGDTNLSRANLKGANLSRCLLRGTMLNSAFLDETDFSASEIIYTKFQNVDLSTVKGLDTCYRLDPIINITTLLLSKGRIPEAFLRGASVPRALIIYSQSLALQRNEREDNASPPKQGPLKLFYCYAREDENLRDKLAQHLEPLRREGLIITWYDREITAGRDFKQEILLRIDTSELFLALVSPAFISSDYCNDVELCRALNRHIFGEMRVIPVILRSVDWQRLPLGELLALPKDGKPVTAWKTLDKGLEDVAQGIRTVVKEFQGRKTTFAPEISVLEETKGIELLSLGSNTGSDSFYWEALEAFRRAVHFNPYNMDAWTGMAEAMFSLKKYQDTLLVCERVLQIPTQTPHYWATYTIKAETLERLERFEEAKQVREEGNGIEAERKEESKLWLQHLRFN
jgi:tetratricopeptide (TPR) repeat protein